MEQHIKIVIVQETNLGLQQHGVISESVWAVPIDSKRAMIKNVPFFASDVCLDDIVEMSGEGDVRKWVRTLQSHRYAIKVAYASQLTDKDEANRRFEALKKLEAFEGDKDSADPIYQIEGFKLGLCVVAVRCYTSLRNAKAAIRKLAKLNGFEIELQYCN